MNIRKSVKPASELSPRCYRNKSLDKAFGILRLLAESPRSLSNGEISLAMSLHKATCHRFCISLLRNRMIVRTVNAKYRLPDRLFDFFESLQEGR